MSHAKRHCLVSIVWLLAPALFAGGCGSSSEDFFEPQKTVNRPAAPKPSKVADAQKPSASATPADSLVKRQREQDRRIGALTGQLQVRDSSRKDGKVDSSGAAGKQPDRVTRPDGRAASAKYEESVRQYEAGRYKAASEGFRELLRSGVPKDVEDQYHYMLGMSHFKMRQFDLAAASLKTVANWKGSKLRADAYFVLGQTYKQLGASRQAKSMFEAALRQSPKADLAEAARNELKGLAAKK
jgi:TolA-binding protein